MKKFFYIMPAVLVCMIYALLTALAGGIGGFQPVAFVYLICPIVAGILLRKGKWWGCFFGIAMGAMLLGSGLSSGSSFPVITGSILGVYYAAMGIVCAASRKL